MKRRRYLAEKRRHEAEPLTDAYLDRWPALPPELAVRIIEVMSIR